MAYFFEEPSHTFGEYLLVPGYTSADCIPANVNLCTPVVKFKKGEKPALTMNIPLVSAVMQSVSDDKMAIALAKEGGISFIYGSQTIENQAAMVARVKGYKAGFVTSDSNVKPDDSLQAVIDLKEKTGHSTVAVTADGSPNGKLEGIITSRDFRLDRVDLKNSKVKDFMTPFAELITGQDGITLAEASDVIWNNKLNSLPIIDKNGNLKYMVFRKDYASHEEHPLELLDSQQRYIVGAGINTRDYMERVPALLEAGVDVMTLDSSEGFTEWQRRALHDIHEKWPNAKIGAGNVVDREGFLFLAEAGADFVKIGIGGGSICITREQKGIGRGQATATIEVAKARDEYYERTGIYIPICSDGGIVHDYHMTLALAMGADFVMLGRYFARFDESPTNKLIVNGNYVKEYWGEGSNRARNWQRYDMGGASKLSFEEGVDSYVPYAGSLHDNVSMSMSKIRHTMCNCGCMNIPELQQKAKITLVSQASIAEGSAHDVIVKNTSLRAE